LLIRVLLVLLAPPCVEGDNSHVNVGNFSAQATSRQWPSDWEPLTFRKIARHTQYELVKDGDTSVVKASSDAAASGLVRRIDINPEVFQIVKWKWKINRILDKGNVYSKDGDDYPARLYVTFAYDESKLSLYEKLKYNTYRLIYGSYPPLAAINYVWDSGSPPGTRVANAYTDRVMMVVVQSGAGNVNQWVEQERNIYQDYMRAFGEPPPAISGVAIMTDTDNTGERAVAHYGDIVFIKQD
jgi:hypothetical protein